MSRVRKVAPNTDSPGQGEPPLPTWVRMGAGMGAGHGGEAGGHL